MLALSDAQRKANDKYIKNNYKQVKLSMPKEEAETLRTTVQLKIAQKQDLYVKQSKRRWRENHKYLDLHQNLQKYS